MKKETWTLEGTHHQLLYVRRYEEDAISTKQGVIQILHGMGEYGDRYDTFAKFLCSKGYIVYIHDHRKHGKSVDKEQNVGGFSTDTWKDMVEDIHLVQQDILAKEEVSSVIMIGHSMGSLLLRTFLFDYGQTVSKAIIIGTASSNVTLSMLGIIVGSVIRLLTPNKPSHFLHQMTVGKFNLPFKPNRTEVDWITRDTTIVDWYVNSPLCGYVYTPRFYTEIAKGMIDISKNKQIQRTPHIPLLFISGDMDPVGELGKGVVKVAGMYENLGYQVQKKLYPNARHELLNELNKDDVYRDILTFIMDGDDINLRSQK